MGRQAKEGERIRAEDEDARPASPFPRYERISEDLAAGPAAPSDPREGEVPRTESYGELWSRARRTLRR